MIGFVVGVIIGIVIGGVYVTHLNDKEQLKVQSYMNRLCAEKREMVELIGIVYTDAISNGSLCRNTINKLHEWVKK